jgi:RNA polymerase sigma-70 factor (ECF subfamily)
MGTLDWMEKIAAIEAAAPGAVGEDWPEAVFAALFQEHYARLVGVAARLVGERAQAEEIADDAFWKLYQRPRLQAPGNNVAGWLYRTVTRLALDRLRSRKRASDGQQRWQQETGVPGGAAGPLQELLRRQEAERVRATLRQLKPAQAQMLLLRYSGLSYQEVAAALRLNPASVGTMLARAEAAFERAYERGQL